MSNNSKNNSINERQWAKYIAERKSGAAEVPTDQREAQPHHAHDLGIDSSLRGLVKISNDKDFVDKVMEKVAASDPGLPPNGQVCKTLPTIAPSFTGDFNQEEDSAIPEKCLASAVTENASHVAENANQTCAPEPAHGSTTPRTLAFAIAGCLAAVAAVAVYFLSPSLPTDQLQTAESQDSPASKKFLLRVGNSGTENIISSQPTELAKQLPDDSSLKEFDSKPITDTERPSMADWSSKDKPLDWSVESSPEKKTPRSDALSVASNEPSVDSDQPLVPDRPAVDERIIQSDKSWDLVLSIDEDGAGTLTINDGLVFDNGLFLRPQDLIRGIGNEAAKRLTFLQPQIGKQIGGSVTIGNKRCSFDSPTEIAQAIEDAIVQLESAPFKRRMTRAQLRAKLKQADARRKQADARLEAARSRLGIRSLGSGSRVPQTLQNLNSDPTFLTQQQARHRLIKESLFADLRYSPSTDELVACETAVIHTEAFLHGLAKEKLLWKTQANRGRIDKKEIALHNQSQEALAHENQINDADFWNFVEFKSELYPPILEEDFSTKSLIQHLSDMELKAQLHANSRSYDLFADANAFRSAINFVSTELKNRSPLPEQQQADLFEPLEDILPDRPDLKGLPLVMGDECRLNDEDAKIQSNVSRMMGSVLAAFDSFANRKLSNDTSSRRLVVGEAVEGCTKSVGKDNPSQMLVTLDQMMQIDHTRLVLDVIDNLREANTDTAIELLARRAKFDLRPEVRFSATQALKEFPKEKYREVLLDGFKYPWSVVAQHSAEAIVRLDDTHAVPELVELLKEHKSLTSTEEDGKYFQKEVVAVNHLRNCLLCHAPSMSSGDPSRGQVPDWESPLSREYYQSTSGTFVRADVTYLTQDFSVVQPVKSPGLWPANQRFDYMVYKRPIPERRAKKTNKIYREAIVFALQSLTRETPKDNSWENWHRIASEKN